MRIEVNKHYKIYINILQFTNPGKKKRKKKYLESI